MTDSRKTRHLSPGHNEKLEKLAQQDKRRIDPELEWLIDQETARRNKRKQDRQAHGSK